MKRKLLFVRGSTIESYYIGELLMEYFIWDKRLLPCTVNIPESWGGWS